MSEYPNSVQVDYPELSPAANQAGGVQPHSSAISPALPSKWWLMGIALVTVVTLALQTWSLLEILGVEKKEAQFLARVEAWELGDGDRKKSIVSSQEALASLREIQNDVDGNVENLRLRTSTIEGELENLRLQRDQIVKEVGAEEALLKTLNDRKQLTSKNLETAQVQIQTLSAKKGVLEEEKSAAEDENIKLLRTIGLNEERLKTLAIQVDSQLKLVDSQNQKIKDVEKLIATSEEFLSNRKSEVANLKSDILQSETLQEEMKSTNTKLTELKKQILIFENNYATLKTDSELQEKKLADKNVDVDKLEKKIAAFESEEKEALASLEKELTGRRAKEALKIAELKSQIADLKTEKDMELAATKKELTDLILNEEGKVAEIKKQLSDARAKEAEELTLLRNQLAELRGQEAEIRVRIEGMASSMATMTAKAAAVSSQTVEMSSKAADTLKQLVETAAEISDAIKNLEFKDLSSGVEVPEPTNEGKSLEDSPDINSDKENDLGSGGTSSEKEGQ